MIKDYLSQLGFTDKEQSLYLALAELGVQPASVVAQKCSLDRVTAYKNLKKLVTRGFVKTYYQNGIQTFGIESFGALETAVKDKLDSFSELKKEFPLIEGVLKSIQQKEQAVPQLQVFQGETGIKNLFKDMLYEIQDEKIGQLRMIASNTFDERLANIPLTRFVSDFFTEIKNRKVDIEIFEASGNLIPEHLAHIETQNFDPQKLPAARGTTNIFLVGTALYVACYKTNQVGIKIKQPEIGQIFHFLFDVIGRAARG